MNSSHDTFVDRRTDQERAGGVATPVLFWYDEEGKGKSWRGLERGEKTSGVKMKRRRVNGIAIGTDGVLIFATATCSRKDQFMKADGRMKVTSRILGRAQKHCWQFTLDKDMSLEQAAASVFREFFTDNDRGIKRAFNVGRVFEAYKISIERRANALDGYDE